MEKAYKHIILVTDALQDARATTETAFNIARAHGATVAIVDTLRPPSAASRWFSTNSKEVFEMVVADKQQRLDELASRFREAGVEAETKVLFGKSSEQITREAVSSDADLVIRYMKGMRSRFPGLFGNTARNLMRVCPCPLLLVGKKAFDKPKTLACVNPEHDESENGAILLAAEGLASSAENLSAVYCWNLYGGDELKSYLGDDAYKKTLDEAEQVYQGVYDQFIETHKLADYGTGVRFEHGDPGVVIPAICQQESVDVVVMSSASTNQPIKRLLGSTIESVLDKLPCSLLVVKPTGFESPVKASDSTANAAT